MNKIIRGIMVAGYVYWMFARVTIPVTIVAFLLGVLFTRILT